MGLFGSLLGRVFGGGGAPPAGTTFRDMNPAGGRDVPRSDATRKPGAYDQTEASKNVRDGLIPVVSSWVSGMKWVRYPGETDLGDLFVRFRPKGIIVKYQSVREQVYDDFFSSSSKGRFVHRYLKHLPYSIVG